MVVSGSRVLIAIQTTLEPSLNFVILKPPNFLDPKTVYYLLDFLPLRDRLPRDLAVLQRCTTHSAPQIWKIDTQLSNLHLLNIEDSPHISIIPWVTHELLYLQRMQSKE